MDIKRTKNGLTGLPILENKFLTVRLMTFTITKCTTTQVIPETQSLW